MGSSVAFRWHSSPCCLLLSRASRGVVWLSLDGVAPHWLLHPVSLAYLGFAFALWPLWIPWSALRWSRHRILPWQEKLMRLLACGGGALAAVLWMPLLFGAAQLNPQLRLGSIDYQVQLPGGDRLWHEPVLLIYAVVICGHSCSAAVQGCAGSQPPWPSHSQWRKRPSGMPSVLSGATSAPCCP